MERHGHLALDPKVRQLLLEASPATPDQVDEARLQDDPRGFILAARQDYQKNLMRRQREAERRGDSPHRQLTNVSG